LKIIVIDDEPEIREVIRLSLEQDQHEIIEAEDGISGLKTIKAVRPDLIISDIKMPGLDGAQMLGILRSDDSDISLIPCIFLSAHVTDTDKIMHLNNGVDACFEKPIHMSLLRAHVNASLAGANRQSIYIKRKMDTIAQSLSKNIHYDFHQYKSLSENVDSYVSIICKAMASIVDGDNGARSNDAFSEENKLSYIQNSLQAVELVRNLHRPQNGEMISWWLILTVSEAHYANRPLYVSDLYVSAPGAKSTINSRIQVLVDDMVFDKKSAASDGRRQSIALKSHFVAQMDKHIKDSLNLYKSILLV